jgi:hypothetical protein
MPGLRMADHVTDLLFDCDLGDDGSGKSDPE